MSLYYECHITVEPLFEDKLEKFKDLCQIWGFRVADLLMQKRKEDSPERSKYDSFCTGRDSNYQSMEIRMLNLIDMLREDEIQVWRYKIEDTVIDSKIDDIHQKYVASWNWALQL